MRRLSRISTLLLSLTLITSVGGSHVASLILDESRYVWFENNDSSEQEQEQGKKEIDAKDFKICPGCHAPENLSSIHRGSFNEKSLNSNHGWEVMTPPPERV